jgi:uncharacterized membrane protein
MLGSLLSFYKRFDSEKKYPVPYASAVITVIFGMSCIAAMQTLNKQGANVGTAIDWITSYRKGFPLLILVYLTHTFLISRNDYWRKLLDDFERMGSTFRISANVLTISIFAGTFAWQFFTY